ncbi:MAG: DEAD/DEAH box helicase family protein, partial [Myxococcota bacterium]
IVDEASQINEPMTLAAIVLARRFVLVGDHLQLPPIVQSEQALSAFFDPHGAHAPRGEALVGRGVDPDEHDLLDLPRLFELDEGLREAGVAGLDRSLFERLVVRLPHVMLEEQYRMNAAIMAFSNSAFYDGKLRAHASVVAQTLELPESVQQTLPDHLRVLLSPDHPVLFQHVEGHDRARTNEAEARAVVELVSALWRSGSLDGPEPFSLGVISPFRAQVQLIRNMLRERLGARAEAIDVDTVERYQGGERDAILVSLVKTERAGEFLADTRRLNVTLTRARKKLILFGHRRCLTLNPLYRRLIEQPETVTLDDPSRQPTEPAAE